jgi:cytochrome oxidase assembly protein ShyY1
MNYLSDSWRRWVAWFLLAVIFAIGCGFLSNWQFNRRTEALGKMQQLAANYDRQPIELTSTSYLAKDEWLPIKLTGHFLPGNTLLVRNRPLDGTPGFLELIPFQREDGLILAIQAGWLPADDRLNPPKDFPKPSLETQTIWGRVRPAEPTLDREAPAGQIATINVATFVKKTGIKDRAVTDFYLALGENTWAKAGLPKLLSRPQLDEGNHLSYAMQWIVFAVLAFMALVWAVRQEIHFKRLASDPNYRPKTRKKVGDEDNAAEDIILLSASGN